MSDERGEAPGHSPDPRRNHPWKPPVGQHAPGPSQSPRHADNTGPIPRESRPRDDEADAIDDLVIRPFLLTGGRTRPAQDGLRVETLLQSSPGALSASLRFEARQIVELCQRTTSVAELAAALRVPLGVARVLVSDLVADGSLTLVQREELSVQMIERIRDRVRAL
jgi:Protein of unknown function (DUF742)